MVKHYLGQFEGLPWTKWPNWVNQEAALESYRCYKADILPNISVRNEREVNLSIWDMEFNGGMAAENQRLYQVLMSAAWMIKNDPFCTFKVENGQPNPDKIAIERSNGALSLQYAILTLQNTGASFNSDNLTKLLFRSTSNFFQLRTIMAMKQCKFEQEMKISEEAQQRFLNEYNNYTYFQFGQNEGLDQAWREAYNQANIAFAKQEMDIALKTWGNGGTPEAYLEEKEAVLKNTIIQEIDNLIATMNQRIATATQSQQKIETEILQLLKEENEKKQKHIRGLETNDAMYKNVTKYFNWFYPGRTDEEFQAKLDSYKNKSLEEAEREMKDEVSRLVDAWNVNINDLEQKIKTNIPEFESWRDDFWKPGKQKEIITKKKTQLLNQHKGNPQSVKAQLDKEWDEKFPALLALIKDDQRLIKLRPCIGKELFARFAFDIDKLETYLTKIYPLSIQMLEFCPYFYQWFREEIDNPDALETVETNLTETLSEFKNRKEDFQKNKKIQTLMGRNQDIATWEDLAGHCKNDKDVKLWIQMKKGWMNHKRFSNTNDINFIFDFYPKFYECEKDLSRLNQYLSDQGMQNTDEDDELLPNIEQLVTHYIKIKNKSHQNLYIFVENNWENFLRKYLNDTEDCETFEQYILKKYQNKGYSSDEARFLDNVGKMSIKCANDIENLQKMESEAHTIIVDVGDGDTTHYTLEKAIEKYNSVSEEKIKNQEHAIKIFYQKGWEMEDGVKWLVNESKRKNLNMKISKEVEKAFIDWRDNNKNSYLKFDNVAIMRQQLGGDQELITFLNELKKYKDEYLSYYNYIDLNPYFPSDKQTTTNSKQVIISVQQKIDQARQDCDALERQYEAINNQYSEIWNDVKERDDKTWVRKPWQFNYQALYKKYDGDKNKVGKHIYCSFYDMLCYKIDGHGKKSLTTAEYTSIIENTHISNGNTEDDGMITIKDKIQKKWKQLETIDWWGEDKDPLLYFNIMKKIGAWNDGDEKILMQKSKEDGYQEMINRIQTVYASYSGEDKYQFKNPNANLSEKFTEIATVTQKLVDNANEYIKTPGLVNAWNSAKSYIKEKTLGELMKNYPAPQDAMKYFMRIGMEYTYRQTFNKMEIKYPETVKTDEQKTDWLKSKINNFTDFDLNYFQSQNFNDLWSQYSTKPRCPFKTLNEFLDHVDNNAKEANIFLEHELAKETFSKWFGQEYENSDKLDREKQIQDIDSKLKDLWTYDKEGSAFKTEMLEYNTNFSTKNTVAKFVLNKERDMEGWRIFMKVKNLKYKIKKINSSLASEIEKYNENSEDADALEEIYKSAEKNNQNFECQECIDLIKEYEKVCRTTLDVEKLQKQKPNYVDFKKYLEVEILKTQLTDTYGYTNEEINNLLKKDDEQTLFHLKTEKNRVEEDLKKLKSDTEANKFLQIYKDFSHFTTMTFEELMKKHNHSYEGVMFYIVYFAYNALIDKKSEKEMLGKYQNDFGTAIVGMMKDLDIYFAREKEFNGNPTLKNLMDSKKWDYEYMMEHFPVLKTNDYLQDVQNAIYLIQNVSDEEIYLTYLAKVGEEDTHLSTFDNSKTREKKKYLLDKKKEFETYEKKLETDEMNELFTKFKEKHKEYDVDDWAGRYRFAKALFSKIDYKEIKNYLTLKNLITDFEEKYKVNWTDQEQSSWTDDKQINYLKTVVNKKDEYESNDLIKEAIEIYNKAFPNARLKKQKMISEYGEQIEEAAYVYLRKGLIQLAKTLLGERFDEKNYPDSDEGIERLKSDIKYEEQKKENFQSAGIIQTKLNDYNSYFKNEPNRDDVWVRKEFNNDADMALNGLEIYMLIDELNDFYGGSTYKRDELHNQILQSSDKGKSIKNELLNHINILSKEKGIMVDYNNRKINFKSYLDYWNSQHGTNYDKFDALRELGVFQGSQDSIPKAKKAIAELLIFYRNQFYPDNQIDSSKALTYATKLENVIQDLETEINEVKGRKKKSASNKNVHAKVLSLHLPTDKTNELLQKYDKPEDTLLHCELYELIEKYNEINPNKPIDQVKDVNKFIFNNMTRERLKKYLTGAVQEDWLNLSEILTEYKTKISDEGFERYKNDVLKFTDENDVRSHFLNAFEAMAYLRIEPFRLEFNDLMNKQYTLEHLLRNYDYNISVIEQYLDYNLVHIRERLSKGLSPMLIPKWDEFIAQPPEIIKKVIDKKRKWHEEMQGQIDKMKTETGLTRNDITAEQLQKYVTYESDIPIIMKILDHLPEFNEKFGKKINASNLDELCSEERNWKTAYFNVRILPLIHDYNYIANKKSEPGLSTDDIIGEYIGDDLQIEKIDEAYPEIKTKIEEARDSFLDPHWKEYNSVTGDPIAKLSDVTKIYPKIDDAERFLRIEKYCKPIRKMIKEMKTMKYDIPTQLELDDKKFEYDTVKGLNPNIDALEQYELFKKLKEEFEKKDAEEKRKKSVINPKINDINRMRRKLGLTEISYDKYNSMEFENAKQALDEEIKDLNEKQREKENQKNNSIGGGFNSGTSFGGTVGQPLRFSALNAQRQTNPLTTNPTTTPATTNTLSNNTNPWNRPGMEVNRSGIGDLTRGNAPLRLTGFNRETPKPVSDSLFSLKSSFDSDSDDDNPIKPKQNDFTKPLRPSNKFAPPVSIRRWILDKQRAQRLKKDSYPATSTKPTISPIIRTKSDEPSDEPSDDDTEIPEIKPLSSPVILVHENDPEEKKESITNKLEELKESNLTLIKTPKMPDTGKLLPIPIDQKTKIKTSTGIVELPTRARKDAPLFAAKAVEIIPQRPVVQPVESKVFMGAPMQEEEYRIPPRLQRRQMERRETFIPNRNTTKQEVDRKIMELRQRNRMKNAPLRVQRQQQRAIPQATYKPPIQVNNTPLSILENPQLRALMKI
ncbi:hypothetical protein M9Y10_017602 [Tritrichomonas musculus]|uniref:Uncharacterized protein n=1 Tax=Tritrichomonas musculus TaxID=1915356 RepID=A0ABR2HU04_9EUKA